MENLQISQSLDINSTLNSIYQVGDIVMVSSSASLDGFLLCDGSTVNSSTYPELHSILGTYYDPDGLVCKLPNLLQSTWTFPTHTVGNSSAYPASSILHSTSTGFNKVSENYTNTAGNHTIGGNSTDVLYNNHNHSGYAYYTYYGNVASNLANRSNGSGQGTNLAIYGHTHLFYVYGSPAGGGQQYHYHAAYFDINAPASNHTHSISSTILGSNSEYIPENVISLKYWIKY